MEISFKNGSEESLVIYNIGSQHTYSSFRTYSLLLYHLRSTLNIRGILVYINSKVNYYSGIYIHSHCFSSRLNPFCLQN